MSVLCCHEGCGATIEFALGMEERLRRTHEWWHCPFGHRQHFSGKTPEERRIAELEQQIQWLEQRLQWRQDTIDRLNVTCVWPGCYHRAASERGRHLHMVRAHGMPTLAAIRAAEEEAV